MHVTNQSNLGWQVVEPYKSDELASSDEDKCLKKVEKVAEEKAERRCKKLALRSAKNRMLQRGSQSSQELAPPKLLVSLKMGHLKQSCPKQQYRENRKSQ